MKAKTYSLRSGFLGAKRLEDIKEFASDIGRYGGNEAVLNLLQKPGTVELEAGDSGTVLDVTFDFVQIRIRSSGNRVWTLHGALN